MIKVRYCDIKNGDLFKICLPSEKVNTPHGKENDLRWWKKTQDGALQTVDIYGKSCEADGHKMYPYADMPVWVTR